MKSANPTLLAAPWRKSFVAGVVDAAQRYGPLKVLVKLPGDLPRRQLRAPLDAGQVADVDADGRRDISKSLVAGMASFPKRLSHEAQYCNNRKWPSSPVFAKSALAVIGASVTIDTVMSAQLAPLTKGVGRAIRKVRKAQKRTLQDLADAIGWDAGNLSRVERDAQQMTEPMLQATARELGMTVSQLYRLAEISGENETEADLFARIALLDAKRREELARFAEFLLSRAG